MKKYELTDECRMYEGIKLYRIRRLSDGLLGGYVESEHNLSHEGDCFVYDNAYVYGDAYVYGNAKVLGRANISNNAKIYGNAKVSGNAEVYGNATIYGNAVVYGNARVYEDAWVFANARIDGNDVITDIVSTIYRLYQYNFTISVADRHIRVGCKAHSFDEWQRYVDTKSTEYLSECLGAASHKRMVKQIKTILKNYGSKR